MNGSEGVGLGGKLELGGKVLVLVIVGAGTLRDWRSDVLSESTMATSTKTKPAANTAAAMRLTTMMPPWRARRGGSVVAAHCWPFQ